MGHLPFSITIQTFTILTSLIRSLCFKNFDTIQVELVSVYCWFKSVRLFNIDLDLFLIVCRLYENENAINMRFLFTRTSFPTVRREIGALNCSLDHQNQYTESRYLYYNQSRITPSRPYRDYLWNTPPVIRFSCGSITVSSPSRSSPLDSLSIPLA